MKRKKNRDILFLCVILLLIGSLVYQGYRIFNPQHEEQEDAGQMLFEVVHFQMEILNSSLMDVIHMDTTEQLNGLKLAAYSAHFGHERMVKTFGENDLNRLPAIEELVNKITSWQIGGERPLRQNERDILVEYSTSFADLLPIYSLLVDGSHHIVKNQANQLDQLGQKLDKLISD